MAEKKTTAKTAPAPAVETVENPVNKMIDGLVEKAQAALKEFLTLDQEQIDALQAKAEAEEKVASMQETPDFEPEELPDLVPDEMPDAEPSPEPLIIPLDPDIEPDTRMPEEMKTAA